MITLARFHNGRIEHILSDDAKLTRCGLDAKLAAKFRPADRGQDSKVRPLCEKCR